MKLEYTSGCICDSLSVDGVETIDMSPDKLREVIHELVDREQDLAVLQDLFMSCVQSQGEYSSSDEPCECCGDFVTTYTLEIQ